MNVERDLLIDIMDLWTGNKRLALPSGGIGRENQEEVQRL
jgi:hypothetical protein